MTLDVGRYLDRLESMIDLEHVEASLRLQEAAYGYQEVEHIPVIINFRDKVSKERKGQPDWPRFSYSEVFHSPECMLLDELEDIYVGALVGDEGEDAGEPERVGAVLEARSQRDEAGERRHASGEAGPGPED